MSVLIGNPGEGQQSEHGLEREHENSSPGTSRGELGLPGDDYVLPNWRQRIRPTATEVAYPSDLMGSRSARSTFSFSPTRATMIFEWQAEWWPDAHPVAGFSLPPPINDGNGGPLEAIEPARNAALRHDQLAPWLQHPLGLGDRLY